MTKPDQAETRRPVPSEALGELGSAIVSVGTAEAHVSFGADAVPAALGGMGLALSASYLQVVRDRSDGELTSAVKDVVRTALEDHREILPSGGVAPAVSRALEVLRNSETITEEILRHSVWVGAGEPEDNVLRENLNKAVNRLVKRKRLSGVAFPPDNSQLGRPITRVVRTEEGVTLQYSTGLEGHAVRRSELPDGSTQFTITTRKFTDAVLPENSSRRR